MSDILPVRMQDFLYSRKPELREQQQIVSHNCITRNIEADGQNPYGHT